MGWYLDLGMGVTPVVKHDPPLTSNLSLAHVQVQQWPPCPVCGIEVRVHSVRSPGGLGGGPDVHIPQEASCPRGHDLRAALIAGDGPPAS
jgi:hypothetical protein